MMMRGMRARPLIGEWRGIRCLSAVDGEAFGAFQHYIEMHLQPLSGQWKDIHGCSVVDGEAPIAL